MTAAREWYDHWRERPDRIGRTRDWLDCAHCAHKSVYRGLGVRVCAFGQQPADCQRYSYKFHPWLRADGHMWCHNAEPEQYDDLGLPIQADTLRPHDASPSPGMPLPAPPEVKP